MNKLEKFLIVLLLFLLVLLFGCSNTKVITTPPQLIKPPSILLEECTQTPIVQLKTNKDLLRAYQSLYYDFQECNNTKRALKEWYDSIELKLN